METGYEKLGTSELVQHVIAAVNSSGTPDRKVRQVALIMAELTKRLADLEARVADIHGH
jgi:hypothetical protein